MNIFQKLFGEKKAPASAERVELMNGTVARFTAWNGDAYSSDIYRSAVDAIARNAGKLKGAHIVNYGDKNHVEKECKLNRLLQVQPNPYMNAYDMLYKITTHYYLYNNAFILIQRDDMGEPVGLYPINTTGVTFLNDQRGVMYCQFDFRNGKQVTFPYTDMVHLRRHFNGNDLLGDYNNAIMPTLELAHTQNEGMVNSIRSSANIRGILKFTQIMAPEKLKEEKEQFISDYLSISNDGGIVATDQKMEYTPIEVTPASIDEKQLGAVQKKIYDYLGISEGIVNSTYTENEWAAFYESVLEPFATQLSMEFTRKLFTERERAFGNSIIFESGRLQFASNATKVQLIKELMPLGLLTVNQALEILNLPSVEDGDKRLQTLNVVDASKANKYQLGGNDDEKSGRNTGTTGE